ncbi:AraC family transcriptional regulator [Pseudoteredinibacter isoporae]|uniref:AraC family transcriptional regulator n=1 Tax=Pseudoteredinibacter isoporae TaxID=570281 RepID=UPI003101D101
MGHSVRIGSLKGYQEVVATLGGDPEFLFNRCSIPIEVFEDEDNTIPYSKLAELLELTAIHLEKPDFGLHLGSTQNVDTLGPLSIALLTAETVGDAMQCFAQFSHIQSSAIHYHIDDQHPGYIRAVMNVNFPGVPHRDMPQAVDHAIAVGQSVWKQLASDNFQLLKVEVPHEPLHPTSIYGTYFDARIEFNTESIAWYISKKTFDTPLPLSNAKLHQFTCDYLREHYPRQAMSLSALVERELRKLMETESCTRDSIAASLSLHPKTMQRRLAQENCNFESIRDQVRKERATYYLCNTEMPFGKIAELIGYSDQAALSRSCQRWFSKPPREIRGENKLAYQHRAHDVEIAE